jgi:hypothetical protein
MSEICISGGKFFGQNKTRALVPLSAATPPSLCLVLVGGESSGDLIGGPCRGQFRGMDLGLLDSARAYNTCPYSKRGGAGENGKDLCGWAGVAVSPMTTLFAESLGMAEPCGAIFDRPERLPPPPY